MFVTCLSVRVRVCRPSRLEPHFCEGEMEVEHAWGYRCFAGKYLNWSLWILFLNTLFVVSELTWEHPWSKSVWKLMHCTLFWNTLFVVSELTWEHPCSKSVWKVMHWTLFWNTFFVVSELTWEHPWSKSVKIDPIFEHPFSPPWGPPCPAGVF